MLKNFAELMNRARTRGGLTVSVAAAQDRDVLLALKTAQDAGLVSGILVGDEAQIRSLLPQVGLAPETPVIHEADPVQAARTAVKLVRQGQAQILMKGQVGSGDFLRAVVDKAAGLRTSRLLSHLSAYEVPGSDKVIFMTDSGMNVAPTLDEKKDILMNALLTLHGLGVREPRVAVLAASEVVSDKIPATTDARALAEWQAAGELPGVVEGPVAMDVALNPEAARHKGIDSKVSGVVDLFLVPSIETGNILSKALIYYAGFKNAGVILGATHPVVMVSRADAPESKLHSLALACLLADSASGSE
ncbi:MAG TPA: phosphate acyltransferase [Patescibacteria group bacterium]|nr:phosphate acyltransferase [Patescibacteria group bacterium]